MNHVNGGGEVESPATFFARIPNPTSEDWEVDGVEICAAATTGASTVEATEVPGEWETTGRLTIALAVVR